MRPIQVLIADDHPVFRYGLRSLLANDPGIEVVGEAESAATLMVDLTRLQPDVLLLDIRMPGPTGIDIARELRRNHLAVRVLILTAYDDDEHLISALQAGVYGYLLKNASHEVLSLAIRQIHAGQKLLTSEQTNRVLAEFEALAQTEARELSGLTSTELEILKCLADGITYTEMSTQLYLSEPTLKRKIQGIVTKMDLSNRTQAVAEAIRRGLI